MVVDQKSSSRWTSSDEAGWLDETQREDALLYGSGDSERRDVIGGRWRLSDEVLGFSDMIG